MPDSFLANKENIEVVNNFFARAKLREKAVIEFRHKSWLKHVKEIDNPPAVFCSVDAPKLPRNIISINDIVYLRLHGREQWYSWIYIEEELKGIANMM